MKLVLAGSALATLLLTGMAQAQGVHPDCTRFRNKVGCTCAMDSGGCIRPSRGQMTWLISCGKSTRNGGPVNEAFAQCMRRAGRI